MAHLAPPPGKDNNDRRSLSPQTRAIDQTVLWLRFGWLRRQGRRLSLVSSSVLQSGHRHPRRSGVIRNPRRIVRRCDFRSDRGAVVGHGPDQMGPTPPLHVPERDPGRGQPAIPVLPTRRDERDADLLVHSRGRLLRQDLHNLLRNSEQRSRPRTDQRLRPAHFDRQFPLFLRLSWRRRHGVPDLAGLPRADRGISGRPAQSRRLSPFCDCRCGHHVCRNPHLQPGNAASGQILPHAACA